MRPRRLGRYELLRHLASGGMARVYLARATGPGGFARHVVVKTVPAERRDDDTFVAMFLDEARLIATLHHQHIAQVFEVGRGDDGTYFLAMEYVHGETVRDLLEAARQRRARLPLELGLSITCAAASGLHHAHERRDVDGTPLGIVHRDVSPSNLILGYDGSIKLIDFGIAKAAGRTTDTATGFVKGKAGYMAPEQARGYPVDRRSDVFALGVLAYELTTQTRALHAESQFEIMRRTAHAEIEPPSRRVADYPAALEDVVMTALEVDPDDRFQDADAMRVALDQVARELGLAVGATSVIRALDSLFVARPEPWLDPALPLDEDDAPAPAPSDSEPQIMVVPRTPTRMRLARGTETPKPQDTVVPLTPTDPLELVTQPVELTTQPFERERPRLSDLAIAAFIRAPEQALPHGGTPRPTVQMHPVTRAQPRPVSAVLPLPPAPMTPLPAPAPLLPELQPPGPPAADPSPAAVAQKAREPSVYPVLRPRSRTLVLGAIALIVTGAVLAYLVASSIAGAEDAPVPSPPEPAPAPAPMPKPTPPPAPPAAQTPVAPGTVLLHVTTEPSGATVVLDGVRLGTTPFSARVPAKPGKAWLKVRMRKHVAVKTRVSLEQDVHWDVELRRRRRD